MDPRQDRIAAPPGTGPVVRTIQGVEYTFYPLPALAAWPVWLRLQKLSVGPLLQAVASADMDMGPEFMVRAATALVLELDVTDRDRVVLPLLSKVTCNGIPLGGDDDKGRGSFSKHFAARYGLLMEVLAAAIEVNFLDFYKVLKGLLLGGGSLLADLATPKTSNPEPTADPEPNPE